MIYCFFDDSGKESDPHHDFVIMAGLLANHWVAFDLQWQALLLKHDIPEIHLRKALTLAKRKGWNLDKLNSVLNEFAVLIRESGAVVAGIGIHMEPWRALPSSTKKKLGGDAQIFCCSRIVQRLITRLDNVGLKHERLTLIFDQDFEFARNQIRLFEGIKKFRPEMHERIAQLSFADSRTFYPLQAADMLAWETRRQLINQSGGRPSTTRWNELMTALPSGQIEFAVGEFWTQEWFDQELPKFGLTVRESPPS